MTQSSAQGIELRAEATAADLQTAFINEVTREGRSLMCDELVLVPTMTTAARLRHQIASHSREGICAGLEFMGLEEFADRLRMVFTQHHLGCNELPHDPWSEETLTWRILAALNNSELVEAPEFKHMRQWLAMDVDITQAVVTQREEVYVEECEQLKSMLEHLLTFERERYNKPTSFVEKIKKTVQKSAGRAGERTQELEVNGAPLEVGGKRIALRLEKGKLDDFHKSIPGFDDAVDSFVNAWFEAAKKGMDGFEGSVTAAWDEFLTELFGSTKKPKPLSDWDDIDNLIVVKGLTKPCTKKLEELGALEAAKQQVEDFRADVFHSILASARGTAKSEFSEYFNKSILPVPDSLALAELRACRARRYPWARKIAQLFRSYMLFAPDMLNDWQAGENKDLDGKPLYERHQFQPLLWRILVAGTPAPDPACLATKLRGNLDEVLHAMGISRIHLYGHTFIPETVRRLCTAIALESSCQVLTWITNGAVAKEHQSLDKERQAFLENNSSAVVDSEFLPSIVFHGCMGATRQIEILKDLILDALERDESLDVEDIAVALMDFDTFASPLAAAFSTHQVEDTTSKLPRVWMARRPVDWRDDIIEALESILDIASGRATRSAVLGLFSNPAVMRKFGVKDEDLSLFEVLVDSANISWGFNPDMPERKSIRGNELGTWAYGLRRIALGVALGDVDQESALWEPLDVKNSDRQIAPCVGIRQSHICAASMLVYLVERLYETCEKLAPNGNKMPDERCRSDWGSVLRAVLEEWVTPVGDSAKRSHFRISQWLTRHECAKDTPEDIPLTFEEIRALFSNQHRSVVASKNVLPGRIIICSIEDLSMLPVRRAFILGADDSVFPRLDVINGDDVLAWMDNNGNEGLRPRGTFLASNVRTGRQRLVSLAYACEQIDILYDDRNIANGLPRDIPAGIMDLVPDNSDQRISWPLMPFMLPSATDPSENPYKHTSWTYTKTVADNYDAISNRDGSFEDLVPVALSESDVVTSKTIDISDLLRFFKNPPQWFANNVLRIRPEPFEISDDKDQLRIGGLSALEKVQYLDDVFSDPALSSTIKNLERTGAFPFPAAMREEFGSFAKEVDKLRDKLIDGAIKSSEESAAILEVGGDSRQLNLDLPDGFRIVGTMEEDFTVVSVSDGERIPLFGTVRVSNGAPTGRNIIPGRIKRLAAIASARAGDGQKVPVAISATLQKNTSEWKADLTVDEATSALARLVRIFDLGRRIPLPLDSDMRIKENKDEIVSDFDSRHRDTYDCHIDSLLWQESWDDLVWRPASSYHHDLATYLAGDDQKMREELEGIGSASTMLATAMWRSVGERPKTEDKEGE